MEFCQKLACLFFLGQALLAHLMPCWWVGWWLWRAGSISQDTYLLYSSPLMFPLFLVVSLPRYQRQTKIKNKDNEFLSCLCCILATISSNMRCRLFLAKQQLSQSGIVSMFCSPKTFSIKIMPSSLEQF